MDTRKRYPSDLIDKQWGQCLADKFDWTDVLVNKSQKMLKFGQES